MTIDIDYGAEKKLDIPYEKVVARIMEGVLDYENCPYEVGVSVVLTDNEGIRQMNLGARNIDTATGVLPPSMIDYEVTSDLKHVKEPMEDCFNLKTGELMLGDIMISVNKVEEQAEECGHSMPRELALLTARSMLHLYGYDHTMEEERLEIEQEQNEILEHRRYRRWGGERWQL